jgi:hypothetical protein
MDEKLIERDQEKKRHLAHAASSADKRVRCSFCAKTRGTVRIVAGPGVFICNECVARCAKILAKRNAER